jgi:peptide deformylase
MTVLRILEYPDPRLKTVARKVTNINDAKVQKDIDDMLETLLKTPHCGGLAATQLDIKDPYYIFVFFDNDENSTPICVVNAEIIDTQGEVFEDEGCMSVYPNHIRASVTRPKKTKIKCLDRHGKEHELERDGYLAKLFVHETDHLDGKVYIDHLSTLKRGMIDKKITKVIKGNSLKKE